MIYIWEGNLVYWFVFFVAGTKSSYYIQRTQLLLPLWKYGINPGSWWLQRSHIHSGWSLFSFSKPLSPFSLPPTPPHPTHTYWPNSISNMWPMIQWSYIGVQVFYYLPVCMHKLYGKSFETLFPCRAVWASSKEGRARCYPKNTWLFPMIKLSNQLLNYLLLLPASKRKVYVLSRGLLI